MTDKYHPRFRPSVYFQFLNEQRFEMEFNFRGFSGRRVCHINCLSNKEEDDKDFTGDSVEECLDKAIAGTNFEKEIK